mmetsp:Transcript_10546/g.41154  ORF Transcript_10546/g.41154 Transcript_10546/m.41154 type:complete len:385 (-) Transcript_10546:1184-2338(-)
MRRGVRSRGRRRRGAASRLLRGGQGRHGLVRGNGARRGPARPGGLRGLRPRHRRPRRGMGLRVQPDPRGIRLQRRRHLRRAARRSVRGGKVRGALPRDARLRARAGPRGARGSRAPPRRSARMVRRNLRSNRGQLAVAREEVPTRARRRPRAFARGRLEGFQIGIERQDGAAAGAHGPEPGFNRVARRARCTRRSRGPRVSLQTGPRPVGRGAQTRPRRRHRVRRKRAGQDHARRVPGGEAQGGGEEPGVCRFIASRRDFFLETRSERDAEDAAVAVDSGPRGVQADAVQHVVQAGGEAVRGAQDPEAEGEEEWGEWEERGKEEGKRRPEGGGDEAEGGSPRASTTGDAPHQQGHRRARPAPRAPRRTDPRQGEVPRRRARFRR